MRGLKVLNRAAEDAVKEASPIFIGAVKTGLQRHKNNFIRK
jgi:hypothetical protein